MRNRGDGYYRGMSMSPDPWDLPERHGFSRETALSVGLICAGVSSLGRATYADLGEYYVALFGVSNGIERLGKLVWFVDFRLTNGRSPTDRELRGLGHELKGIIREVRDIEVRRDPACSYPYPSDAITEAILDALTMFADASRGRYANFATLSGTPTAHDPVIYWWEHVVKPILERHFRGTPRAQRAEMNASAVEAVLGGMSQVLHHDETGGRIDTVFDGSLRSAENEIAQKFGRFYTLRLVRWMSDVYRAVLAEALVQTGEPVFFGHDEFVQTFRVPDQFLLSRKKWPLR